MSFEEYPHYDELWRKELQVHIDEDPELKGYEISYEGLCKCCYDGLSIDDTLDLIYNGELGC